MKQQLEDLEKTYKEQLTQEQALTRKLKRKAKAQKKTIADLQQQQQQQQLQQSNTVGKRTLCVLGFSQVCFSTAHRPVVATSFGIRCPW